MECAYHAGVTAIAQCRACQLGLCADCAENKPVPQVGFAVNAMWKAVSGLKAGDPSPVYVCRQTCDAYERSVRGARAQETLLQGVLGYQLVVAAVALLVVVGGGLVTLVLGAGVLRTSSAPVPSPSVAAVAPAASTPAQGLAQATPALPPLDLSHVEVGQRYVFTTSTRSETWVVDAIEGETVRYTIAETGASLTWRSPGGLAEDGAGVRADVYALPSGDELPCLVHPMGASAEYRYATASDGRVTFPGQIERLHGGGARSWQLQAIESPRASSAN